MNNHFANNQPVVVRHNVEEMRFEVAVGGSLAVADYEMKPGVMVLTHTFVPVELRGQGLAEKLVRAALDHARAERLKVVPACSYVGVFLQRHPEYQDLAS
jgi:predicted GNAT family acetyltransferase